ncbi:MAG: hypothetical protein M5T52_22965, partial [Ignavibacteriaceae bacterium]|nr:hypothetical protein [Ignavibacteriaceae bacterium]
MKKGLLLIQFTIINSVNYGIYFQFNKNNTETFRGLQDLVTSPTTEKYYQWNNLNAVTNLSPGKIFKIFLRI